MKNYVNEINEILYDYDIEGLADLGCPEDEYMNEAKMVFENINANMTVEEVADVCKQVYDINFLPNHSIQQFEEMASEILMIIG